MASNRDPRKDYRINRRGRKVTTSATRKTRSNKAQAPKPTSSSTRRRGTGTGSKRITSDSSRSASGTAKVTGGRTPRKVVTKPITGGPRGAQGPATAPVQGPYRKPKNIVFEIPGNTKTKSNVPPTPGANFNPSKKVKVKTPAVKTRTGGGNNLRGTAAAALVSAAAAGSLRNPITKAKAKEKLQKAEKLRLKNVSKGTNKDNRPKQGAGLDMKRIKAEDKKAKTIKSFDAAFAAARKAGKSTFTWRGKKYNTKLK